MQNSFYLFCFLLLFLLRKNVHLWLHLSLSAAVVVVVVCCVQTVGHVAKQLKHVNRECYAGSEVVPIMIEFCPPASTDKLQRGIDRVVF